MAELHHECGIVAVYHLPHETPSPLVPGRDPNLAARLVPRLLLEIQNRGQLAAGMSSFDPERNQLLATHKDVGSVTQVFRMGQKEQFETLMQTQTGSAAIGHVRYATCGLDDPNYAQPFERHHIEKPKWFSFAFNGQLANYGELREEILNQRDYHLARETDTEVILHAFCQQMAGDRRPRPEEMLASLARKFDGAYNIVYLNARGDMIVSRDPMGFRPLCYAIDGPLFVAASESVALDNIGIDRSKIRSLEPGHAIIIQNGQLRIEQYAPSPRKSHCFFEWIYFANVASTLDDRSVYVVRKKLGEELARQETLNIDEDRANTIVVPVPDTAKAAADSMAFELGVPSQEGLIRNRYVGRTFIEGKDRADKVRLKYTPLREVLEGKRVLLVEDTIVRSTTMKALISQLRDRGKAKEVHVRVACPPIIAPCFYGIDMSRVDELFAPKFLRGGPLTSEVEAEMARVLGADSLRYLPLEAISRCLSFDRSDICQACLDGDYPTVSGQQLYQIALDPQSCANNAGRRTYDVSPPVVAGARM